MLAALRTFSKGIIFKIIAALIVLSFVSWGIGDIFRKKLEPSVAQIGKSKIYEEELRYKLSILQKQYQEKPEILRAYALQNLIREKLTKKEIKELGLIVNNELVYSILKQHPQFKNKKGVFDIKLLQIYLQQSGKSEQEFFYNLTNSAEEQLFFNIFRSDNIIFVQYNEAMQNLLNEVRSFKLVKLSVPKRITVKNYPKYDELLNVYNKNKQDFFLEEAKDISILDFNCKKFFFKAKLTNDEINLEYKKNLKYKSPEKREILQIMMSDKQEIVKIEEELKKGADFLSTAKKYKVADSDLKLGLKTKEEIFSNFRTNIFALKNNQYSSIVKSPFGFHIFKITKIIPEKSTPFKKVKNIIIADLKERKSCNLADKAFKIVMADISKDSRLEDLAKKHKLEVIRLTVREKQKIASLSTENSEELKGIIDQEETIKTIHNKSFLNHRVIYQVNKIIEERYLSIEEVKKDLVKKWQQQKHTGKWLKKAQKLHKEIRNSKNISNTLNYNRKRSGISITSKKMTIQDKSDLPKKLLGQLFSLQKKNEITEIIEQDNKFYMAIFMKKKIEKASKGENFLSEKKFKRLYLNHFNEAIYQSYFAYLAKKHKVRINQFLP